MLFKHSQALVKICGTYISFIRSDLIFGINS